MSDELKKRVEAAVATILELWDVNVAMVDFIEKGEASDYLLVKKSVVEELTARETKLTHAITATLEENAHLADGDNCVLVLLKQVLSELNTKEGV